MNVLSAIQRLHDKRWFRMASMDRVQLVLDGFTRYFAKLHCHEPLLPLQKELYSRAAATALLATPVDSSVGGCMLN